ncbi:dynamin family protein [Bacillus massiliigorillae]|uniref:dynamin family protein n=1 Tax=Bacillus massiliigorillae TaxID=1243664 RepID=UPI0003A717A2|nr:dynamin family protein [Bacillus massiliigorillae]
MIKTPTNQTGVLSILTEIYKTFGKNKDTDHMEKMKQLIKKAEEQEVQLAFCGHFSAGKSSMINYLMGSQILPSSPIPTSANIVKVKKGKEAVKVHFFDGKHSIFEGQHDMKDIKAYCKEGEQIKSIHIYSEQFPLPEDCAVLDTPGIDSTDDAHRVSTESTLHLADIVLYVMDYNHVQSQENFMFAKKMNEAGKKLYLVVNMIDKHDASELSFEAFQDSVANSFAQWNIEIEGIFYTSLRQLDLPNNQIEEVKEYIHERIKYERAHLNESILQSAEQLIKDHLLYLQQQREEEIEQAEEVLAPLDESERLAIVQELRNSEEKQAELKAFPDEYHLQMISELNELLKSVYLLTADNRETIRIFLESQQANFKVGMFFAKNKTEAERTARANQLLKELQERTKTQLDWHVKVFAAKCLKDAKIDSHELETKAQEFNVLVDIDEIKQMVMNHSDISGEYVLLFSQRVADLMNKKAKDQMLQFFDEVKPYIIDQQQESLEEVQAEINRLKHFETALSFLQGVKQEEERLSKLFKDIVNGDGLDSEESVNALLEEFHREERNSEIQMEAKIKKESSASVQNQQEELMELSDVEPTSLEGKEGLQKWSERLTSSAQQLRDVKGFSSIVHELEEKAERMKNQTYTIALFGAFSAGKSSFANALFGDKVLPVSPNPTTAVINKVMAAGENQKHRTAKIKLKSVDMLLEDVRMACKQLNFDPATLEEAFDFGNRLHEIKISGDGKEKAHLSFVAAFHKGYPLLKDKLGQEFVVEYDEYTGFAADESKSCFVDEIVLYFDCDLTKKGIVLVDTPGADSINARHTNAAFHYIKNSDAILFVTYYNHPFAKADREFLIQLGRVKDSFAMDKMFFICNAIDLAQTEEELYEVTQYIKGQLEGFGIRFPRLYPLSSKEALQEQKEGYEFKHSFLKGSGMDAFQRAFSYFIQHELVDLACTSAQSAIRRAATLLQEIITAATASVEEKQERLQKIQSEYAQLQSDLQASRSDIEEQKLIKEADELIYYINQRVFLRFSDFFKESFNPAVIKDDGRDLKEALRIALRELLESIGFDFAQEMRATSLRLENQNRKLVKNKQDQLSKIIAKTWNTVEVGEYTIGDNEVPQYNPAFGQLTDQEFKKELSLFKNPKTFFERNDKQKMADALQEALQTPAHDYLQAEGSKAKGYYSDILQNELQNMQKHVEKAVEDVYISHTSVLQEQVDVDFYQNKEDALKKYLEA